MTAALVHRGPDDDGYYRDDEIALGFRRLSIIDLSGGHQPIPNETDTVQLICNGEIYNSPQLREELISRGHTFKTKSDVEVILHLYEEYGKDCVKHLRGMFAFALWDSENKRLVLARDHTGQKSLFYARLGDGLIFASEAKAILASGLVAPDIDLNGMWHYMSLRFMPAQYSMFKNIHKLPAATTLVWERGRFSVEEYWQVSFVNKLPADQAAIEESLDAMLRETVQMHLLSDVRVGTFLSGGIDSGTISAMVASASSEPVPTFSIGVREQSFNELPYAEQVAKRYGMEWYKEVVEADILDLLPTMVYHLEEPADPFGVGVYLVSDLASKHVKVVLGGDGGDENFAGYDRHAGQRMLDYYSLLPAWLRRSVMKSLISAIPNTFNYKSLAQRAAWMNDLSLYDASERYAQSMTFLRFTHDVKERLFTADAKAQMGDVNSVDRYLKFFNADNAQDLVDRMLYTELMTRMPDHNLVMVDRMTMAHSLECRSPLIDHKLVEFAASIPGSMKLNGTKLKYIFRRVAARYLPKELVYREKQGFGFPLGKWMRGELAPFVSNLFAESRFVEMGVFDGDVMRSMFDEHLSGRHEHSFRLWILVNLEIWHRIFVEQQSVSSTQTHIADLMGATEKAA